PREQRLQLFEAEWILLLALRLDDAVREVDDRVALFEVERGRTSLDLGANAERQRRQLDADRRAFIAKDVRVQMSCVRVSNRGVLQIEDREGQRHECAALGRAVNELVETLEQRDLV